MQKYLLTRTMRYALLHRKYAVNVQVLDVGAGFASSSTKHTDVKEGADGGNTTTASANPFKMCGWQIHSYGELDELQYSDKLKKPRINRSNEILVRVRATTVNPIDVAMLGGYGATVLNAMRCNPGGIEFPLTLGREFCGEIVQRGMGVGNNLCLGDRVWGVVPVHSNGAHAQFVSVPDFCLSRAPEVLSNEEAAAVLYAGLTAWSGLYISGGIGGVVGTLTSSGGGASKRVLVLGGSGGVGSTAIQMLKSQGAQVLATCSENAIEMVRNLGADLVVDYCNPTAMGELHNYAPFDVVLDCSGQGGQHAEQLPFPFRQYITFSSPILRNIDSSGMGVGLIKNLIYLAETNVKALSKKNGLVKWAFFAPAPQGIEFLKGLVERKKLLPAIDSTFPFDQLPAAFQKVQSGHLRGKVVLTLN